MSDTKYMGVIGSNTSYFGTINGNMNYGEDVSGSLATSVLRGLSAYEVAVKAGYSGTVDEWLASLIGDSVQIEVVQDDTTAYILKFISGDQTVVTPNLLPIITLSDDDIGKIQTNFDDVYVNEDEAMTNLEIAAICI